MNGPPKDGPPTTIVECDRRIEEYRKALGLVSERGRCAVIEQIDVLLDRRLVLSERLPASRKATA